RIPGSMELWWVGANGSVEGAYWYEGGQWSRYRIAPDRSASVNGGMAAVSRIPGSLEIWWVGETGGAIAALDGAYWYEGGQWARYRIAPDAGASPSTGIAAVSRIPGSMEIWWVGPQREVKGAYWYEGGKWTAYQHSAFGSGAAYGGVAAVSRIPGSLETWWIGGEGAPKGPGSVQGAYWYDTGQAAGEKG
ncbi:hypothetical protein ACWCRG_12060, partial [Streptomyces formicae]